MEIPDAIRKGIEDAKKNMIEIPILGTSIPHEVKGHFGAGKVLIMPAVEGTGIIAGGPVRAVLEWAALKMSVPNHWDQTTPATWLTQPWKGLDS
jgi:small subunit ribosomal protein S5